jgi:SAM-dependent methyltransferase
VRRRWNRLISGDERIDHYEYVCKTHLKGRQALKALSLGCGTGQREMSWARQGVFARIDAYDLSPQRIAFAQQEAQAAGLADVLHFHVRDIYEIEETGTPYDVILGEQSIHHFSPLGKLFEKLDRLLADDGMLVVNEFVGPTRFQWTDEQLALANALLALLPKERRVLWNTDWLKRRNHRPSLLSMILSDPSEAVESSRILERLRERFEIVDFKPYGGTLLHLALSDIGHHFVDDGPESRRWLDLCFYVEDCLLDCGILKSDFVLAVCVKKGSESGPTTTLASELKPRPKTRNHRNEPHGLPREIGRPDKAPVS